MPISKDDQEKIEAFRQKEAEDLAKILSQKYKIPYADLSKMTIYLDALKILPESEARAGRLVVFQNVGRRLSVGLLSPNAQKTKEILEELKNQGYTYDPFLVSEFGLSRALNKYKEVPAFMESTAGIVEIAEKKLKKFQEEILNIEQLKNALSAFVETKDHRRISDILEVILAGALNLEASDIHIEPEEERAGIRLRLDGVLQPAMPLPRKIYELMLARLKLVSELMLNIHDRAQDGRFTIRAAETDIEIRTSVLPGPNGESVVLRVLNPKIISLSFEELGMQPYLFRLMEKELKRPNGMIINTGPTGSGKTTTLYAFVKKIKTPGIKIITIEDPIEYHLRGVTQTQVNKEKGYDFLSGLRSSLRQDPDVILVGEIRDFETAQTAMHAALTGHLVFSTLHTNNAAGAIPRLIDLGVKPEIIAPAMNITMAQRLVRRLCVYCRKKEKPDKNEEEKIRRALQDVVDDYKKNIPEELFLFRPVGCPKCNETGYKGRLGIFEAILINEKVEEAIISGSVSEAGMRATLREQKGMTMFQDGILKVLSGITSLDELERVAEME